MTAYTPAQRPTMYFIGVTTGQSSIMKVFPAWAETLRLDAVIRGIDFVPGDRPERYRAAVEFIRADPLSRGALVTTHKMNLLKASRDLFGWLDPFAATLGEVSCISKRGGVMRGHAKDPVTVGAALAAIVPDGYWANNGEMLVLGAGGSGLALTLHLHNRMKDGRDVPRRITVTDRNPARLAEMRHVHQSIGFSIPAEYVLTGSPAEADACVGALPAGSMVVNATGLGKDGPGSPLSDRAVFPERGIAWEFNYRGDLVFLDQARAQAPARSLRVEDGWVYFIHGWTRVIAEVFDLDIPASGPAFDNLSAIARDASRRQT